MEIFERVSVTKALDDELELRHLMPQLNRQNLQKNNASHRVPFEDTDSFSTQPNQVTGLPKPALRLKGNQEFIRKRTVFVKLLIALIGVTARFFIFNRKDEQHEFEETYLVYPCLSNPQLLLQFTSLALSSELPAVFSTNRLINKAHQLMLFAIFKLSRGNCDRERSIHKTGIGLVQLIGSNRSFIDQSRTLNVSTFRSHLIAITGQKQIHFVASNGSPISEVVVWDKAKSPRENLEAYPDSAFEHYTYITRCRQRKLKITPFYNGGPVAYSEKVFFQTLSHLISIQKKNVFSKQYSWEASLKCIRRYSRLLKLSDENYAIISEQLNKVASSNHNLFALRPQHGDFVPRNILQVAEKELAIIDSSSEVTAGFVLTDVATLIFSFLAGDPFETKARKVRYMLNSKKFDKMRISTTELLKLTNREFFTGLLIGLGEKMRICEMEGRASVTLYWAKILEIYLEYYINTNKHRCNF